MRRLQRQGNNLKKAESLVETVDRERAAFIKKYFHVEWPDLPVYHAMINTASGDEAVVKAMLAFVDIKQNLPKPQPRLAV